MGRLIRKIEVLNPLYTHGVSYKVGQETDDSPIVSITIDNQLLFDKGIQKFKVKKKVRDEDNPNIGGLYVWKEITIGSNDTVIVEYDIKAF